MKLIQAILVCCALTKLSAQSLPPFVPLVPASTSEVKSTKVSAVNVDCFSGDKSQLWAVDPAPAGDASKVFSLGDFDGKQALKLSVGSFEPDKTMVRILLPGGASANGDLWAKSRVTYISFLCKGSHPAEMYLYLFKKGKPFTKVGFAVSTGDWQKVIIPIQQFGLKGSTGGIDGLGFRVNGSAQEGDADVETKAEKSANAEVEISAVSLGVMPFTEDMFKKQSVAISLLGDWRFSPDAEDRGLKAQWYADAMDDSGWSVLKSGLSWQEQGVSLYGYGWYRQKISVPKEAQGLPLVLDLTKMPSDDDVWFNGTRIGGFKGEYKYNVWLTRSYVVPPSLIRYGAENTIALRLWGGHLTFIGNKSGLIAGPLVATFDPYHVSFREPGKEAVPAELFDLSDAQRGKPFDIIIPFPGAVMKEKGTQLNYRLTDYGGRQIKAGKIPLAATANGNAEAVISIDRALSQTVYLRGRMRATLIVEDDAGNPIFSGNKALDHLKFEKRDETALPALPEKFEDTPYGKLKLVDEIDCSTPLSTETHPYVQGGFSHSSSRQPPGDPVDVKVSDILGKKARESGNGWFAYRVGSGKLTPHKTYLLRMEYPEDKPRFAPIEIQTGQNFMDVGWKNGTGPDGVYDNWPLSKTWQWYDVIVPVGDRTVGTGGTGTAPAENGFWVYFMNKIETTKGYYTMWSGGPAVARMKLYEIDAEKNAPVIRRPQGLPTRTLGLDWERQPDHDPADFVQYAKLMGYSSISPIMLKWHFDNYAAPLNGYTSIIVDDKFYWAKKVYDPATGEKAASPIPGKKTQHERYLEATKKWGLDYIPRFEWGGSMDLPVEARAIDVSGEPAKPNRFAQWCTDILNPLAWDDLKKLMDNLFIPYAKDNPQLMGALWRIRCNRVPISYAKANIELFAKETNTTLPPGGDAMARAWAAGEMRMKYDAWWHQKRAEFHIKLVKLLQSYRPDLELYYYNWDEDKFALIQPCTTAWAFIATVVKPPPQGGKARYMNEEASRAKYTAADYIEVMRTGNFGPVSGSGHFDRADYGIRPELYKGVKGIQIFAPANFLCYANLPDYLNYFKTDDGLAVSNVVAYDEIGSRSINSKYEGNMITPAGPAFSMALELLPYFHSDARTLNYTVYTYGRGFADAHRRFAQAFLALPAIPGTVVDQADKDLKVRTYASPGGTYVGVAYKGYASKKLSFKIPSTAGAKITDLVTGQPVSAKASGNTLEFEIPSGPMELNAYLIQ